MSAPTPAETPAAVQRLHALYCELTKRPEALRFYERAWHDLLWAPEYQGDAVALWKDVQHLVRYLRMGIRDAKRNEGCLKLRNFLAPDTFLADLAEAKSVLRPAKPASKLVHTPAPDAAPMTDAQREEMTARLREFREAGLKGATP